MTTPPLPAFAPVDANARIDALDVLRGFALIGICIANVEFFNRPVVEAGQGMQAGLAGLDRAVAWVVNYFVTGKFWMIFSLLFGMGFALMHARAKAAGQAFMPAYGRRTAALLLIGLLHHTLLWSGDILISYAVAAAALTLTLFAPPRILVTSFIACAALPQMPGLGFLAWFLAPIILAALVGIYLRSKWRLLLPALAAVPGVLMLLAAGIAALGDKTGDSVAMAVAGALLLVLGLLAWRYGEPAARRPLRAGLAIVLLAYALVTFEGATRYFAPSIAPAASASDENGARQMRAREIERSEEETDVLTGDSYAAAVAMRVGDLLQRMHDEVGFSIVLVGVFLVGSWFVRSGVIVRSSEHLPLFRRLALLGIPAGIGLGLLGSLASTGRAAGADSPAYDVANGLMLVGSVPAALGYVGAVIVLLHSHGMMARIRVLAPFGRMALTNYLAQSVVMSLLFYGHGSGLWGMDRAGQIVVALGVCLAQVGISHWWLARFRHGPAEWVWRALTYLSWPGMRRVG